LKDLPTRYWLEDVTSNVDLEEKLKDNANHLRQKYAIVTVHDIYPQNRPKILVILRELDKLDIPYNIAVVPLYNGKKKNDIRNERPFIDFLLANGRETALHGFYHERKGEIEEFSELTDKQAKGALLRGLRFFKKAGIGKTKIFIPPTWAVNKQTVEALEDLKFNVIETEEEIILLDRKKRLLSTVLNWDLGSMKTDLRYHRLIKKLFRKEISLDSKLIRLAVHPKDPAGILKEQCAMIKELIKCNYQFVQYSQLNNLFRH
jgi:predicted deacetylase